LLALPGCFVTRISSGAAPMGERDGRTGASLFWGITSTTGDADECHHGFSWVESYHPWWSPIVTGLTIGIVTPLRMQWQCAAAPAQVVVPMAAPLAPTSPR
jgi:hypothetical protein